MPRSRRMALEPLEDRSTPVVWNNPWADPGHLTLSFAPDGTDIHGRPSTLFSELHSTPTAVWQREALRAFQTWAAAGNINLAVVPDQGVPFGTPGPIQGDPRRGDIRLGAANLGAGQLAATTPFDLFGGWSGSVLLNTAQGFNLGGTGGKADLYTVLLQEAGHVFGIGNSTDPDSAMYELYQGPRAGLAAGDVADLQELYGQREPDRFEGKKGNDTPRSATPIQFAYLPAHFAKRAGTTGSKPFVAAGDLTTSADVDTYSIRVPKGIRTFTVDFVTSGVSLLTARVTVLDVAGNVVGSATAADSLAGDLSVQVSDAKPGATYFVQVEGAADDAFGIGAYRLAVGRGADLAVTRPGPDDLLNDDGNRPRPAIPLGAQKEGPDRRWDFAFRASITDPRETDTYTVRTKNDTPGTLVVAVWGLKPGGLDPTAVVFDPTGRPVPTEVLTNDGGSYTLQVQNVRPRATYAVRIAATDPRLLTNEGNYFLGIDFRDQAIVPTTFAADTLTAAEPDVSTTITVAQSQLLHFALATVTSNAREQAAVRLSVRDALGREVFTLFAHDGQTARGDVLLGAGQYTLVVTGGTRLPGRSLPDFGFKVTGLVRNDPIGIIPKDSSSTPTGPPPPPPPPVTTTTGPYTGPYAGPYRTM